MARPEHYEFGKTYPVGTKVWLFGVLREVVVKPGTGGKGRLLRKVIQAPPERTIGYHTRDLSPRAR